MEFKDGDFRLVEELLEQDEKRIITDKEFYKQMQKLKDRGNNAVPPKKSASAYIIFGKEVEFLNFDESFAVEKGGNFEKKSSGEGN